MLKRVFGLSLVAVAALLFAGSNGRSEDKKDIVDTAVSAEVFKTLVIAVKEAGLVETLKGEGPFTVLAPNDEAFKKIPEDTLKAVLADKEKLKKILLAHVVKGKVLAADVVKLDGKKVNGFEVKVVDGKVSIGSAHVIKTDIIASNGVIHVIDTVLMPE